MRYFILTLLASLLLLSSLQAQDEQPKRVTISGEVFRFNSEIRSALRQTGDTIAGEVGDRFDLMWSGPAFNTAQKQRIVDQAKLLKEEKGWRWLPEMVDYIASIAYAGEFADLPAAEYDSMLSVHDKVIAHYSKPQARRYFRRMRYFFYTHALYYSRFHRTYFSEGTYHFTWVEPETPAYVPDYTAEETEEDPFSDEYTPDDGGGADDDDDG